MREQRGETAANIEKLHAAIAANPAAGQEAIAHELGWNFPKFQYLFSTVRHEYVKEWRRKPQTNQGTLCTQ